jgi:hypothetical protein
MNIMFNSLNRFFELSILTYEHKTQKKNISRTTSLNHIIYFMVKLLPMSLNTTGLNSASPAILLWVLLNFDAALIIISHYETFELIQPEQNQSWSIRIKSNWVENTSTSVNSEKIISTEDEEIRLAIPFNIINYY